VNSDRADHRQAAARHEQVAQPMSALPSSGIAAAGASTELQREMADYERLGANLERRSAELLDPKPADRAVNAAAEARSFMQANAELLSSALSRTAEALERTVDVAEEHARRRERAGRSDDAAKEHRVADRAREYAPHAHAQAEEWLSRAERPMP
jgi:hypothetical protein